MNAFVPNLPLRGNVNKKKITKIGERPKLDLSASKRPSKANIIKFEAKPQTIDASEMVNTPPVASRPKRKSPRTDTDTRERRDDGGGESFNKEVQRGYFFDERRSSAVDFNWPEASPLFSKTIGVPETILTSSSFLQNPKLEVSLANYNTGLSPSVVAELLKKDTFARLSRTVVKDNRSPVFSSWNNTNFDAYIEAMVTAFSLYYTVDSILSYSGGKDDRNDVNLHLQSKYEQSFAIIEAQNRLRRLLKGYCFPSKFANLIRWTYQLYKSSDLPQATNYRYVPYYPMIWVTTGKDITADVLAIYNGVFSSLEDVNNINLAGILARSFPDWIINGLPLSCSEAVYDATHHELWVNQPLIYFTTDPDGETEVYPNTAVFGTKAIPWASNKPNGQSSALPYALTPTYTSDQWTISSNTSGILLPVMNLASVASSHRGNYWVWNQNAGAFAPGTGDGGSDLITTGLTHRAEYAANVTGEIWTKAVPGFQFKWFLIPDGPVVQLRDLYSWLWDLKY